MVSLEEEMRDSLVGSTMEGQLYQAKILDVLAGNPLAVIDILFPSSEPSTAYEPPKISLFSLLISG